jgi:hypothetical protein
MYSTIAKGITVEVTYSTRYPVDMAKRNLTVQLDDTVIAQAKVVAARRGMSLSALVAQQLTELAEAADRYEQARVLALEAMANSGGGGAPAWRREDLYDRVNRWTR